MIENNRNTSPARVLDHHETENITTDPNSTYAIIREEPENPGVNHLTNEEMDDIIDGIMSPVSSHDQPFEDAEEIRESAPQETSPDLGNSVHSEVETTPQAAVVPDVPASGSSPEEQDSSAQDTDILKDDVFFVPENSPTIFQDDTTSRFSGTEWYNEIQKAVIIIAGIGGIGSNLAFQIARLKPSSLYLYDDDTVDMSNMSGQLFSMKKVGQKKVNAINCMISEFTSMQSAFSIPRKFTSAEETADLMFCGFDNMLARKTFFRAWAEHVRKKDMKERGRCLFLDGRLSIDTFQVFAIRGDDVCNMERYRKEFLFSDSEAEQTVCSMKQTTYLACMIGSFMTNIFVNFTANLLNPVIPYDVPFFTQYDAANMLFKTIR